MLPCRYIFSVSVAYIAKNYFALMCGLQVEHDCSFFSDLGADLFMLMELVSKIEDEFGK